MFLFTLVSDITIYENDFSGSKPELDFGSHMATKVKSLSLFTECYLSQPLKLVPFIDLPCKIMLINTRNKTCLVSLLNLYHRNFR